MHERFDERASLRDQRENIVPVVPYGAVKVASTKLYRLRCA